MGRWLTTVLFLAVSAVLTRWIPFSDFFRNVDTMVHELGHAFVTLLLSGQVLYIELYANHGGVTYSYIESGWRTIPLGLAGYLIASIFAYWMFRLYAGGRLGLGLMMLSALAVLSLVLFVRNPVGIYWLIGFIVVNCVAVIVPFGWLRNFYYLLVAFICLEESVMGPITLAYLSLTNPSAAGDAAGLANTTGIPALAWSIAFLVFALWCAKAALARFFGKKRRNRPMFGQSA